MAILVTGAAGFMGSHVTERLLAGGDAVAGIDSFDTFSVCEARTTSLKEFVRIIERAVGKKAGIHWQPMQPGDVMQTFDEVDKAGTVLGYSPCTGMKEGIGKSVARSRETGRSGA